jgi:hypothetical protein
MSTRARATARFADLRRAALADIASLDTSAPAPQGWCISTIARLEANAPELLGAIERIGDRLAGGVYRYPRPSLHVSLLGCTQREPERPDPSAARTRAIVATAREVLARHGEPVTIEIGRLNATGVQLFLEVLTDSPAWARMRGALADAMEALGEAPIRYADAEPMHLNVARVADAGALAAALGEPATVGAGRLTTIDVVITDFVVSPATLTVLDTIELG